MPATEKTWRDQALMHVIFGVSSLVMLVGTVWMLAKDHNREWRQWQLADRSKEKWSAEAQLAQATAESEAQLRDLEYQLNEARSQQVDLALVGRFKQLVTAEDARLEGADKAVSKADFAALDNAFQALSDAQPGTPEAAAARQRLKDEMGAFIHEARRREDALVTRRKFAAADRTAVVSERGIAVGEGKPQAVIDEIESQIDEVTARVAELDAAATAANDYRRALESVLGEVETTESDLKKQIASIETDLNRLHENIRMDSFRVGEWVNRWPVLDALYNGNIKLDQIWLPDLKINYNFSDVARYDRCTNCHQAISLTAAGSAVEPAYPAIPEDQRQRSVQLSTPGPATLTVGKLYGFSLVPPAEDGAEEASAKVKDVEKYGPAYDAGLKAGDEILQVQKQVADAAPIASATAVEGYLCEPRRWGSSLRVKIRRDGEESFVSLDTPQIGSIYGFRIAPSGQLDRNALTVQIVLPESLAAMAGLETGDVIEQINGGKVHSVADVYSCLMTQVDWGQPVELKIRRGLDQPFTSHPRLDLFVGGSSPHKKGEMGCTICHDGQGSATEFKWASHTPNSPDEALRWSREHGWFDNHHWLFPMLPERFIESNCLKCHHEVVELEPSERFPEPPAPKLVKGYHLVQKYGCYGCHQVDGYDGPDTRTGPDLRVEPNYYDVAAQVLQDSGLSAEEHDWAETLVDRPEDDQTRHQLLRSLNQDSEAAQDQQRLSAKTHGLANSLKDVDAPGSFRKVGPSLRHIAAKVDYPWLVSWIRRPADFRPTTRMPQFFGQYEHLEHERKEFTIVDGAGNERPLTDVEYTQRFEAIEVRALAEFLLADSQPFKYIGASQGVTEPASAERGRWLFESRGCLACHAHKDFPGIASNQGPDLSRVAAKLDTDKGKRWLYSWLRSPRHYSSRTVMPNLFLEPIAETNAGGQPTGRVTDPAADIAAFLLSVPADWQPTDPLSRELTADEQKALEDLTAEWLSASFPRRRAVRYAHDGIPERLASRVKEDELSLVGMTPEDRVKRQMDYVARRSISRYGCFGCHDIPGFEGALPIGTPLADWGRKDTSRLAFENIGRFLATHGVAVDGSDQPPPGQEHDHVNPFDYDDDTGYFLQAINAHQRQGFLWQKLRMPRSYDFEATRNKRYDERLRMPRFPFTEEEREAVMTFVLGLTQETPDEQYVYRPGPRQEAIVQGRHVLDKYNCAGCHMLDMERWEFAFEPDWFEEPSSPTDYPFLAPDVTEDQIEASLKPDRRGFLHADVRGMPTRDEETGKPSLVDEDGVPLEPDDEESDPYYEFTLYEPAVVAGAPWLVGTENLLIAAKRGGYGPARGTAYPSNGGDLAKYLYPLVIAEEHKTNPQAIAAEAWGWLPPPLINEGEKVQTEWLHDFLMDPTAIRPAVVLRMPNFSMSSAEASKLVNYFAAKSDAEFPYEYNVRRRGGYLAGLEQTHPTLLDDAMKIVTDGNYCVKCHSVGDFQPVGAAKTLGPNLSDVYRRLRPEYVRRWVANPQRILPYTGMPVNIPYNPNPPLFGGVSQSLFPGPSVSQLDGLVDLLMNFDEYAKRQTSVRGLVKQPAAPVEASAGASGPANDPSTFRIGRQPVASGSQSGQ